MPPAGGPSVVIRGARGSTPARGASDTRYGVHTACLEVELTPARRIVLDCGSGLRSIELDAGARPGSVGLRFDVFLTHYHWDHVAGLPFFGPLYDDRSTFSFHGPRWAGRGVRELLTEVMAPPWFPVGLEDTASRKSFVDLGEGSIEVGDVRVRAAPLHHPQVVVGYRVEVAGRVIVYATDHEGGEPRADDALFRLARGADVLIHDAQYTPGEYDATRRGWGHSTWRGAAETARQCGVGRLVLFHHDPDRSDEGIEEIEREARRIFPATDAAREGMRL